MAKQDIVNALVILVTLALFILALFFKGLTHDILLEAGVFLVSVKLILLSSANNRQASRIRKDILELKELMQDRRREG